MLLKTSSKNTLSVCDYIMFVGTLVVSTLIGIYYGCFGTKQATTKEYLTGGKNMKILPIAVSVAVSHISGTFLIGAVAEVYRYGSAIWITVFALIIMGFLAIFIYLPVFFKLQLTNIYEYLEKRFDLKTKNFALVLYLVGEIMSFAVLAYPPSLTFATASGVNPSLTAFVLCIICVSYTSLGGLKTVIWTDFVQFGIIIASLITIYVIGLITSGGFSSVWNTALTGQRLQVFNFDIDFTARDSFWAYIAVAPTNAAAIVVHQTGVQKFLTLSNYRDCVWSVVYTVINMSLIETFCVFIGLAVYSKYKDCDPLTSHMISKHDQLFPFYVAEIGASLPGVPGLFIAAICSAALSSMSSNLNSLSGVVYKSIICRFLKKTPSEKRGSVILKMTVLVIGVLCSCLVFLVERMGEVFSIIALIKGTLQGPILGIFTLGILFPQANHHGALYGGIGGFISVACLSVPTKYYQMTGLIKYPTKPLSTSSCDIFNQTLHSDIYFSNTTIVHHASLEPNIIFKTMFHYYTIIGTAMTIIIGLIISLLTKRSSKVNKDLLSPLVYFCLPKESQDDKDRLPYSSVEEALEILNLRK